jgi:hypothetical protein
MTNTDTSATTQTEIIDAYFAMWNEEDAGGRRGLIETAWVRDGSYVDPLLEAKGHDGLDAMVAGVHTQFPGQKFRRTTAIDAHHDRARFGWELAAPDGSVTVAGLDVACFAPDGKLSSIAGFFGPVGEDGGA